MVGLVQSMGSETVEIGGAVLFYVAEVNADVSF